MTSIPFRSSPSYISSVPLSQATSFAIEMVYVRPDLTKPMLTPRIPGQLVGFYNDSRGEVELYMVDTSGSRFGKVV